MKRSIKKGTLSLILIASIIALIVAGCGSSNDKDNGSTNGEELVTIHVGASPVPHGNIRSCETTS